MIPEPDPLPGLQADFPAFRIWREDVCGRICYVARRRRPDLHPHTCVTGDPDELRAALPPERKVLTDAALAGLIDLAEPMECCPSSSIHPRQP
jgi:hypothetical protein